ncbi:uncharacterized protein [Clytia hemisphaerica]
MDIISQLNTACEEEQQAEENKFTSIMLEIYILAVALVTIHVQASANNPFTYEENLKAVDAYFCKGKSGNYRHPNGACDHYIACGVGCKNAKNRRSYKRLCTQNIMPCPGGLFYDEKAYGGYGACIYKAESNCLQFQGEVCYGSTQESYGTYTHQCTGQVTLLKLVSKSGSVGCYKGVTPGYWGGCPNAPPINVWITEHRGDNFKYVKKSYYDIKHDIKFPEPFTAYDANKYGFYYLNEFHDKSSFIYFTAEHNDYYTYFVKGKKYRVYYGEDLFDQGVGNNVGKHCVYVYASFYKYYKPNQVIKF